MATALTVVAAVGYCSTLLLQERLVGLTPAEHRGQALGLHTSGMLTMQAVCAALAGSLAELTSPAAAITLLAAASVAVTLALAGPLRDPGGARPQPTWTPGRSSGSGSVFRRISRTTGAVSPRPNSK
ncbi:hypothetical protein ACTOB_001693 [Actinoplanes oblitus]|uniref:Major facilitator superfamily (MFS) profile domain-containing protein n=1 Tax=Actinoplanes oblitus TaxID=3040509 RepID=A0ABY8WL30_9ACTN|nr:hypothetical protein [Actinoplanes oblitus]WIM98117.1 hypothetical protein ACTOB_001693 [Actinoplanes oblitus]